MLLAIGSRVLAAALIAGGTGLSRQRMTTDTGGTFRIYKLQHDVGAETYSVSVAAGVSTLRTAWSFRYIGSDVRLTATLQSDARGEPKHFEERGKTSTLTDVDLTIDVGDTTATVLERGVSRTDVRPKSAFPIASYPPVAVEEALFRRWQSLGRPKRMALLPRGVASFDFQRPDTILLERRRVVVRRYAVTGLLWGRQAMWATGDDSRIVAVANGDAELDRFEAVREGYTRALSQFVRLSVRDGIGALEQVSRTIAPSERGAYALVGATLIDGTGAPPVEKAVIVVRDGRIVAAGPESSTVVPRGLRRRDVSGKTVIPGLWDMHVHFEQVEWPMAQLAAGVTTARDVGNELELATGLRDAIRNGRIVGPRMLLAGLIDGAPEGLGVHLAGTADEARAEVRRYRDAGYVQIKIYQSVPPSLVAVIADEAHRLGMTVTGHVPTGMNAIQFVEAGGDQINHFGYMLAVMLPRPQPGQPRPALDTTTEAARAAIALFKAHHTVLDATLARSEQNAHPKDSLFSAYEPGAADAPPELADVLNASGSSANGAATRMSNLARGIASVGALHAAGIPVVAGTDLVVPGHSIARELELEVRGGFTPMEAIQAATIVAARAMGLDREAGTIAPGKRADLVVLDANPLEDISNVRRIDRVIAAGRMYDPTPLWRAAGFTPPRRPGG